MTLSWRGQLLNLPLCVHNPAGKSQRSGEKPVFREIGQRKVTSYPPSPMCLPEDQIRFVQPVDREVMKWLFPPERWLRISGFGGFFHRITQRPTYEAWGWSGSAGREDPESFLIGIQIEHYVYFCGRRGLDLGPGDGERNGRQ